MALSMWCVAVHFQAIIALHKNHIIMAKIDTRPWYQQVARFILFNWYISWGTRDWKKKKLSSKYFKVILYGKKSKIRNTRIYRIILLSLNIYHCLDQKKQLIPLYRGCFLHLDEKWVWFLQKKTSYLYPLHKRDLLSSPGSKSIACCY